MNRKHTIPPRAARWLLLRFLRNDLAEEVEGDLEEKFFAELKHQSSFKAKINYWYQVFHYFRPFAIRKNKFTAIYYDMYQNYFRISWRSLLRQKMYSAIKIGGLAIGVAACFLISLYVNDELNYDKNFTGENGPYRLVVEAEIDNGKTGRTVDFPAPATAALKNDFPEVEQAGRYLSSALFGADENQIRRSDRNENQHESGFVYFDQELLELLNLPVIAGNAKYALTEPNSIVITKRKAEKYFPGEDAVGKTFIINNNDNKLFKVGAVIDDFPANSHLQFDFLMTLSGVEFWPGEQSWWMASNYQIYITLKPGTDIQKTADKIKWGFIEKYYRPALVASGAVGFEKILNTAKFELQPMNEIYLDGSVYDGLPHSDIRFIWLFGAIAVFIVIIAGINFVNLSTARSANRAKEVGLRKAIGSHTSHLIKQFLTESFLFSLLAIVAGIIMAWLLLPYFNMLASKSLTFPWTVWWLVPGMYSAGLYVDTVYHWYESGQLKQLEILPITNTANAKCDVCNGTIIRFFENGKLKERFTSNNGVIEGEYLTIEENGAWNKKTYRNDSLNGPTLEHNIDSLGNVIIVTGQYKNDKETGYWRWFDKDSVLVQTTHYDNGIESGLLRTYHKNGKVESEGARKNGQYQGLVIYYNDQGKVIDKERYNNGVLIE